MMGAMVIGDRCEPGSADWDAVPPSWRSPPPFGGDPTPPRQYENTQWDRYCGAAVAGPRLALVTISTASGQWAVDGAASLLIELAARHQHEVRHLCEAIESHVTKWGIRSCTLRAPQEKGPYAARGSAMKVETALQLCPGVGIDLVSPGAIRAFQEPVADLVLRSPLTLQKPWDTIVCHAAATAIYAACAGLAAEEQADL